MLRFQKAIDSAENQDIGKAYGAESSYWRVNSLIAAGLSPHSGNRAARQAR
jgi:hypothetical protein